MKIRIFEALDLDRKIMSIKHLRNATGLSLKETKDIVDALFKSKNTIGIEVYVKDSFDADDWDAFAEWFVYDSDEGTTPKDTLKLFRVVFTQNGNTFMSVVLSSTKPRADAAAREELKAFFDVEPGPTMVTTIEEVTSFKNGQVLLMSRL